MVDVEAVLEALLSEGLTRKDVALYFGISLEDVNKIMEKNNIQTKIGRPYNRHYKNK